MTTTTQHATRNHDEGTIIVHNISRLETANDHTRTDSIMLSSKLNLLSIAATLSLMSTAGTVEAFQFQPQSCSNAPVSTRLHAHEPIDNRISHNAFTRRKALQKSAGVTLSILLGGTAMTNSANAKYSTYTRREEDWSERQKNGGELRIHNKCCQSEIDLLLQQICT